jgi:hypothetical protein
MPKFKLSFQLKDPKLLASSLKEYGDQVDRGEKHESEALADGLALVLGMTELTVEEEG